MQQKRCKHSSYKTKKSILMLIIGLFSKYKHEKQFFNFQCNKKVKFPINYCIILYFELTGSKVIQQNHNSQIPQTWSYKTSKFWISYYFTKAQHESQTTTMELEITKVTWEKNSVIIQNDIKKI
jgi:hypothetical protein